MNMRRDIKLQEALIAMQSQRDAAMTQLKSIQQSLAFALEKIEQCERELDRIRGKIARDANGGEVNATPADVVSVKLSKRLRQTLTRVHEKRLRYPHGRGSKDIDELVRRGLVKWHVGDVSRVPTLTVTGHFLLKNGG